MEWFLGIWLTAVFGGGLLILLGKNIDRKDK